MVYQLNGKFGPFTLETDDDLKVLSLVYKIAQDASVYVTNPLILPTDLDNVLFKIKLLEKYPDGIAAYIDNNLDTLLNVLKDFLPGYTNDRFLFKKDTAEIFIDDSLTESDKTEIIKMLKNSYQNTYQNEDLYLNLMKRVEQVVSLLEYRKEELEKQQVTIEDGDIDN